MGPSDWSSRCGLQHALTYVRCLPCATSPPFALGRLSNSCSSPFPYHLVLPAPLARPSPRTARRPTKRRRAPSRVYLFSRRSASIDLRMYAEESFHLHTLSFTTAILTSLRLETATRSSASGRARSPLRASLASLDHVKIGTILNLNSFAPGTYADPNRPTLSRTRSSSLSCAGFAEGRYGVALLELLRDISGKPKHFHVLVALVAVWMVRVRLVMRCRPRSRRPGTRSRCE